MARAPTDPPQPPDSKTPEFLQKGKALIVRRQLQEAVKVCRLGLLAHPTCVEGRLVLGMALMALARYDEVLAEIRVALELEPQSAMAYLLRGEALLHQHDAVQAREALERARQLDPRNVKALKLLEELNQLSEGSPAAARARTQTKVYPARRPKKGSIWQVPSEVLDAAPPFAGGMPESVEMSTEVTEPPEAVGVAPKAAGPIAQIGTEEKGDDEEEEDFTTAPFLPPMHLDRFRPVPQEDWDEQTVSEPHEDGDRDPDQRTVLDSDSRPPQDERGGLEGQEAAREKRAQLPKKRTTLPGEAPAGARRASAAASEQPPVARPSLIQWDTSDVDISTDQEPHPVRQGALAMVGSVTGVTFHPPAMEEEEDEPSDRTAVDEREPGSPLAELVAKPKSHDNDAEPDEEQATIVNADLPPAAALFGEQSEPAPSAPDSIWPGGVPPRQSADATIDVDLHRRGLAAAPADRDDSGVDPPHLSQVRYVSGVEVETEMRRGADRIERVDSELSDISVEMIPDRMEMPPVPTDAKLPHPPGEARRALRVASPDGGPFPDAKRAASTPQPALSPESTGEDDLETRVNFDPVAPSEDPPSSKARPPQKDFARRLPEPLRDAKRPEEQARRAPRVASPGDEQARHPARVASPVGSNTEEVCDASASDGDRAFPESADFNSPGPDPLPTQDSFRDADELVFRPSYDVAYSDVQREEPEQPRGYPEGGRREEESIERKPARREREVDDDEVPFQAMRSELQDWKPRVARTAALDEHEARAQVYSPAKEQHTSETSPGGPRGLRINQELELPLDPPSRADPFDNMPGPVSDVSRRRSRTERRRRSRSYRGNVRESTTTSLLSLLVGEPGSHRWVFLLLGAVGVLATAVGIGLAVRYFRLGEQIEAKRKLAVVRLRSGNLGDFKAAAQSYYDIVARRSGDKAARWALARIEAAIPFEFGEPYPSTMPPGSDKEDGGPDQIATQVYVNLCRGSLDGAEKALMLARQMQAGGGMLYYLAGRLQLLQGNTSEAESQLAEAERVDPKNTMVLRAIGDAAAAQGHYDDAIKSYRRALSINGNHIASLLGQAKVQLASGQNLKGAEEDLLSIVQGPRSKWASRGQLGWANLLLAQLDLQRGRQEEAKGHLKQARQNEPRSDAPFLDELAGVLIQAFQLDEAEKALEQSRKMMPGRPHPSYYMAQIYLRNGMPAQALSELNQVSTLRFAASTLLRAEIYLELRDWRNAEKAADEVLRMSGDLLEANAVKAKVLAMQGTKDKAEAYLLDQIKTHPRSSKLLAALGEVYLGARRTKEARERYLQALAEDSHNVEAQLGLAQVYEAEGRVDEARKALETANQHNRGNVIVLRQLARIEADMGELVEAANHYQDVLSRVPSDPQAHLDYARVLTWQRDYAGAEKAIRAARGSGKNDPAALSLATGRLAFARGRFSEAIAELRTATSGPTRNIEVWTLLVQSHLENQDEQGALRAQQEMKKLFPSSPEAELAAARIEHGVGQPGRAIVRVKQALELFARQPAAPVLKADILVLLGRAYQDSRNDHQADVEYRAAIEACSHCADPLYYRAVLLEEQGDSEKAVDLMRKALTIDPNRADGHYLLGAMLDKAGQGEKAKEAYKKCLSLSPPEETKKGCSEALQNVGQQ